MCVCRQLLKVLTGCRPTATGFKAGVLGHGIGACQLSFRGKKEDADVPVPVLRSLQLCVLLHQVHRERERERERERGGRTKERHSCLIVSLYIFKLI
jgi:hypothetical protein